MPDVQHIAFFAGLVQGGAEKQVVDTCKLLVQKGHRVTHFTYDLDKAFYTVDPAVELIDLKKVSPRLPGTLDKIFSVFKITKLIKQTKPDVVVSYTTLLNIMLGIVGFLLGNRNATSLIGSDRNSVLRYNRHWIWAKICQVSYRGLDGVFSNSMITVANLYKMIKIDQHKIFYIPNLLDVEYYSKDSAVDRNQQSDTFNILVPARVTEQKNQLSLVAVASRFHQQQKAVSFRLAGKQDQKYTDLLKSKIAENGLSPYFELMGEQSNLLSEYLRTDLVYLPSKYEGLSNSLLEALACKSLVLVSRIPEFTEIVEDEVNGFIVDSEDASAVYAKILKIEQLSDTEKAMITNNARASVLKYGHDSYYDQLTGMFRQVKNLKTSRR